MSQPAAAPERGHVVEPAGFERAAGSLSQLANRLAAASTVDEVMSTYLAEARTVIPARAVGIYLSRAAGRPPSALADGVSEQYLERYEEVGRQVDPVLQAVVDTRRACRSSDLMSREDWCDSEFYRDVLSVHGLQSTLKAPIVAAATVIGTLNFGDRDPAAFDGEGALEIATVLGHMVGLAVSSIGRAEELERERAQLLQAFDFTDDPLVITDLRTGSRTPNAAARAILSLLSQDEADLLLEDLLSAHPTAGPFGATSAVGGGPAAQVVLHPLNLGTDRRMNLTRLSLRSLQDGPADPLEVTPYAQALLSPRERQIAAAVSLGLHDQQIADNLVLSVHTVKQHLKNIYKKLGVNSRVELTRLVLLRRPPSGGPEGNGAAGDRSISPESPG